MLSPEACVRAKLVGQCLVQLWIGNGGIVVMRLGSLAEDCSIPSHVGMPDGTSLVSASASQLRSRASWRSRR